MKRCTRCKHEYLLSDFGINRAAKDGRNHNCKYCIREKSRLVRAGKKDYDKYVQRKSCSRSEPIWRLKLSDREKVKTAYARGITDRIEIRRATRVFLNDLMDIIAELNDAGEIRWNREVRRFELAA